MDNLLSFDEHKIASLRYKNILRPYTHYLYEITGCNQFSICIETLNNKIVVSNSPEDLILDYSLSGLFNADNIFSRERENKNGFYFPRLDNSLDLLQKSIVSYLEDKYKIFNVYAMTREDSEVRLVSVLAKRGEPVEDCKSLYNLSKDLFAQFIGIVLESLSQYLIEDYKYLRSVKAFNDNQYKKTLIKNQFNHNLHALTNRELNCLYWVSLGKTAEEVALILAISVYTVREYLQSVLEKLEVKNIHQAVNKYILFNCIKN